jgi:hypothetical protein
MSIIAAGTTTTTALSSTGNTDGTLQFQVNGTTPSVTLNTLGAIGVGSSPAFGTSGQVLTSGGSTVAPAWATPTVPVTVPTFTATGTISAAGLTVALNSDGTVSTISGTTTSFSAGASATLPSNRTGSYVSAAYDPINQKIVILAQYSSFLMGYVGTISGTTITFGSEYQIVTSAVSFNKIAYDTANNKFVALYAISNTQRAKVLTVSGTTISAGTEATLTNSAGFVQNIALVYNPIAGQFVSAGYDGNNDTALWSFSVSGTSITENFYPPGQMLPDFYPNNLSCNPLTGTIAMAGKSVVVGVPNYPYVYPVTVSSTSVSVGSGIQLASNTAGDFTTPLFFGSTTAGYGLAIVFTTSNSNNAILLTTGEEVNGGFSLGGTYAFGSGYSVAGNFGVAANPAGSNIVITWPDGNDGYAKSLTAFVNKNGTAVFGSINNLFTPANGVPSALVYCTNIAKMVFISTGTSSRYTTIVFTPDGYASNAQSFIGFSTASAASGASVGVSMFANMNTNVSGLTLGAAYNVTYTGTLTTSITGFPYAGKSYGATKIFVGV